MRRSVCKNAKCCTGCFACMNVCPVDAIKVSYDRNGFRIPRIIEESCIGCGKCERVCPINATFMRNNSARPICYALQADKELCLKSSSGGAFGLLAERFISDNGFVCGVQLNDNPVPEYALASDMSGVERFRGSKYVEAEIGFIFRDVKELLDKGKKVLFSGCPCHVAGLLSFLGKPYSNLLTADLICHSITPLPLFKKYISELGLEGVTGVEFRNKKLGWNTKNIIFKMGKTDFISYDDVYMKGFTNGIMMRTSCESCRFAGFPRVGDITIGDFWTIDKYKYIFSNDGTGVSLVIANNLKGKEYLGAICNTARKASKFPFFSIKDSNRFFSAHRTSSKRNRFFSLVNGGKTVEAAVEATLNEKYDTVIFSNWSGFNYGAHFTHYALYHKLTSLGYSVLMCEKMDKPPYRPLNKPALFKVNPYPSYALFNPSDDENSLKKLNDRADSFILGSDQLLNWNYFGHTWDTFLMQFIDNSKRKIAYAASFGEITADDLMPSTVKRKLCESLTRFSNIMVREKEASLILDKLGIESRVVLDPVFFLSAKEWLKISDVCKTSERGYIFCYLLNVPPETEEIINSFALSKGLSVKYVYSPLDSDINARKGEGLFCEEWLSLLAKSDYVITDSYHATAFSIILHKSFLSVPGTRIYHLLGEFELLDRAPLRLDEGNISSILDNRIDYSEIDTILERKSSESVKLLLDALNRGAQELS